MLDAKDWIEQDVKISTIDGSETVGGETVGCETVTGQVCGYFMIHENDEGLYALSNVPTGLKILAFVTEKDARWAAADFNALPISWGQPDKIRDQSITQQNSMSIIARRHAGIGMNGGGKSKPVTINHMK